MKTISTLLASSLIFLGAACTVHGQAGPAAPGTMAVATQAPISEPDNSSSDTGAPLSGAIYNTVTCHENEDLLLRGATVSTAGNGVLVQGNCTITIDDSQISSGENALLVEGNGTIIIRNSQIQGKRNALLIQGNGTVEAENSNFTGHKQLEDNGDFEDNGGNTWSQ